MQIITVSLNICTIVLEQAIKVYSMPETFSRSPSNSPGRRNDRSRSSDRFEGRSVNVVSSIDMWGNQLGMQKISKIWFIYSHSMERALREYWRPVKENPHDFDAWTTLLKIVEKQVIDY